MHLSRSAGRAIALGLAALAAGAVNLADAPNVRAALDRISAQSMRGHVSFLASDLLEGRATPSPGLNVAAEYIAAQFRRAGLEVIGDSEYFQTAKFMTFEPDKQQAKIELETAGKHIAPDLENTSIQATGPIALSNLAVLKLGSDDAAKIAKLRHEDVQDKAIALYLERGGSQNGFRTYAAVRRLRPALLILAGPALPPPRRAPLVAADQRESQPVIIGVREGEFAAAIEHAKSGSSDMTISVQLPAPKETDITLRNVAGILRGSDPVLKDTYILVTAHYDHVGLKPEGSGDRIYNGANDDASGTASVIEIATALASMDPKPRRSIVFMALFGEEMGLLGSQYYGRHPLVPLVKTIADVNLEQLGRTDSNDGSKIASASFTGFDFSGLPAVFEKAGKQTGVKVYKDDKRSDPFFARSDNQALADLGIPAHTLCVAFEFPDYHAVGDEWQKMDYENMAKIDRMVALGVITLADTDTPPKWNESEPKAKKYSEAWRALHDVRPSSGAVQ